MEIYETKNRYYWVIFLLFSISMTFLVVKAIRKTYNEGFYSSVAQAVEK